MVEYNKTGVQIVDAHPYCRVSSSSSFEENGLVVHFFFLPSKSVHSFSSIDSRLTGLEDTFFSSRAKRLQPTLSATQLHGFDISLNSPEQQQSPVKMTSIDHLNHTVPGIECPAAGNDILPPAEMIPRAIPDGLDVAYSPGGTQGANWMKVCCAPHEVHWINDCIAWCELPPSRLQLLNGTDEGNIANSMALFDCFNDNGRRKEDLGSFYVAYQKSDKRSDGIADNGGERRGVGLWGWAVIGLAAMRVLGA
jgi:hypothetical protein